MRFRLIVLIVPTILTTLPLLAHAQVAMNAIAPMYPQEKGQSMSMPMNTPMNTPMNMGGPAASFKENILRHMASGTDVEPDSTAPPMLMQMHSNWMLMLHGQASVVEQQQSGPRGADKLFSANWVMPMAQRSFAHGELTLRAMLSLEPATISGRYYPELFQQGETAFGKPIIDGQHPHNLFMELAALYDLKIGDQSLISLYAAPVGDPALGPVAFPHRASASLDPLAPLGHHLEDSTHIAYEVLTGGVTVHKLRVEASGFHGREPGENRWTIYTGALDSWSSRLTVNPVRDWSAQYSLGHLHSPEALHSEEDVLRQTASISYHHAWKTDSLDALALWGRNHTIASPTNSNGYLLEATAHLGTGSNAPHGVWGRIENVDRTTDLLRTDLLGRYPPGATAPAEESVVGRAQAYTGGYAYRFFTTQRGSANIGAQGTFYNTPEPLRPLYGNHPAGVALVLNFQMGK